VYDSCARARLDVACTNLRVGAQIGPVGTMNLTMSADGIISANATFDTVPAHCSMTAPMKDGQLQGECVNADTNEPMYGFVTVTVAL
jgi:hypothetical protein